MATTPAQPNANDSYGSQQRAFTELQRVQDMAVARHGFGKAHCKHKQCALRTAGFGCYYFVSRLYHLNRTPSLVQRRCRKPAFAPHLEVPCASCVRFHHGPWTVERVRCAVPAQSGQWAGCHAAPGGRNRRERRVVGGATVSRPHVQVCRWYVAHAVSREIQHHRCGALGDCLAHCF